MDEKTLRSIIEATLAQHPRGALCEGLMRAGVPAAAVNSVPEALAHPHAAHRQILVQQGDYTGVRSPMRLFGTPGTPGAAPPRFAQDTRSVLGDLGYTADEQAQLHHAGGVPG